MVLEDHLGFYLLRCSTVMYTIILVLSCVNFASVSTTMHILLLVCGNHESLQQPPPT